MYKFRQFLLAILFVIFLPAIANAAVLYMEPSSGIYGPGDSFALDIKILTEENCINTVEAGISFPRERIQAADFFTGESLLSVWVNKPDAELIKNEVNTTGHLNFAGGIPGGYCGRIPGDPGESNILGRIIFYVPNFTIGEAMEDSIEINFLDNTRALINDGFGTADKLTTKGAVIEIAKESVQTTDAWNKQIENDNIPPEPFIIELNSRDDMFDGGYFIIFNTTDKQSGVDRYEVLEIRPGEKIGVEPEASFIDSILGRKRPAPMWKKAEIPYLLLDQELLSIIRVRAIDKAGNERQVEYIPPQVQLEVPAKEEIDYQKLLIYAIVVVGLITIVSTVYFIIKTRRLSKIKREKHEEDKKN